MLSACLVPETADQNTIEDFHVQNGRLVFRNAAAISRTITLLSSMSEEARTVWIQKRSGFSSWATSGETMGIVGSPVTHSPAYLSIINKDGLYQVSNQVILVRGFTEYIIEGGDEERVKQLMIPQLVLERCITT
jgi:hypothetical protein